MHDSNTSLVWQLLHIYEWMKIYEQRGSPKKLENLWQAAANERK